MRSLGESPGSRWPGGVVTAVDPRSPAEHAGIVAGDRIVAADGHALADVLDWRWHADGAAVTATVVSADGTSREVTLRREPGQPWGVTFADALFDGVRTCENACSFCFVAQLPPGLRQALYLRDDDFRLSFLSGNFITLTNLSDQDVGRIVEQALTPLYVSLHAVDPKVRRRLVCADEDRALERFDELAEGGIDIHVQIVLVPGVNDGPVLDETLTWLAQREGVASVGVVPVGYTRHQVRHRSSFQEPAAAASVIEQVQRWQFAMRERDGVTWVHLADEFYLNARAPLPLSPFYDGFPQYENGIGLVRVFVDEVAAMRSRLESAVRVLPADRESVTIVTGMMAATTLAGALDALNARGRVRLLVIPNAFFGGNVSVTGLLTGRDIVSGIRNDAHQGTYVLPDVVFNADGETLDGMTLEELRTSAGSAVRVVSSDATGLLEALRDERPSPPH